MSTEDDKQPLIEDSEIRDNSSRRSLVSSDLGTSRPTSEFGSIASGRRSRKSIIITEDDRVSITLEENENLNLTWSDVNVFVGETEKKSSSCWKKQKNQKYQPKGPKQILNNVFGVAEGGQLLAIMGGSGAGKTTLLNILTQRNLGNLKTEGHVYLNGEKIGPSILRSISAYVQQDDLFIGTLKVKEHLIFQALLRMGKSCTYKKREDRVNAVIQELGLGKCENTLIGGGRLRGISGGEKKRLAFASEVLTDPPIMFCDEPTSGLDSFMAQQVVAVLKSMAKKGKTIICTIHQPSSPVFAMFDQLCLMAEGRICWLGPTKSAAKLFDSIGYGCPENFNPADHYIRTLAIVPSKEAECRKRFKRVCNAYEESEQGRKVYSVATGTDFDSGSLDSDPKQKMKREKYKATWMQQFRALLWRSALGNLREPLLVQVRLYQNIVIALILGLVYLNTKLTGETIMNVNGVLFLFVSNMTFQFVFSVVNVFCEELPIFMREHLNGNYRVDAYYLAKMLSELPQYIVFPLVFTTILYWMTGLNPNAGVFFTLCGINILTANVAVSLGYMISCITGNVNIALSVTPVVVIPFMLFAGFYLNQDSVPIYFVWLKYLSYFKYSYEAVSINQWSTIDSIPGCENGTCPENGHEVLQMLSFEEDKFVLDIGILAVIMVGIRIIGFLALLIRSYVKK